MFKNYLKVSFRNLFKYRFISFINIFGLTVGIACCLLILTYILHEISYDRYNKNAGNIYRVERKFYNAETGDLSLELGAVAPPFAQLLLNDFPEIREITRFLSAGTLAMRYDEKKFNEKNVYFADEHLFEVFDVALSRGNPRTALKDPFSVILTEELARKYFGSADPLDKVIRLDNQFQFKVTGVYKKLPSNAHFHPEILLSFNTLRDKNIYGEENLRTNWGNNSFYTYLLLPDGYDPKRMERQFPAFLNRHIPQDDAGKFKPTDWTSISLKKLTDIHLHSHTDSELEENGDIKRVYIFSAIALFILLIACINYMNLSTARSMIRAREIGVRKVVGAERGELIAQFLSESVLLCWTAALLALLVTGITLSWINRISGQDMQMAPLFRPQILLPLLMLPFFVGILSGLYPALFLSSFQPVKVLKGIVKVGGSNISFRRVLVVTQFAISIVLIISTAVVFLQLRYMQSKSLGFNKDYIVTLANNAGLNSSFSAFKTELLSDPSVLQVCRTSRIPSGRLLDASGSQINRGNSLAPTKADIKYVRADEGFLPTYGIRMSAGRNFNANQPDTTSFLINEAAVKALGIKSPSEAIGKEFQYGDRKGTLVGVFNDFHFESLHQRILPLVLFESPGADGYNAISVKISGNNPAAALTHVEAVWKKFLPEIPYEYSFLEERFNKLYESEKRQEAVFTLFSCIAVFIACLGLLGLSAFAISQRVKEIGVRKVLGATVGNIVGLLSRDFMKLVIIAAIIAFPIAWFAMDRWLEDFAYRIHISPSVFLTAGSVASIVAFATISVQAIRAALANPVSSLRNE